MLVGTATVQQDERAGGLAGRGSEAMAKLRSLLTAVAVRAPASLE